MSVCTFSSLPTELRFIIWEQTFQPRILHIDIDTLFLLYPPTPPTDHVQLVRVPRHTHTRFRTSHPPPVALYVCRESRALALKYYTPSFHSSTSPASRAAKEKQSAIYFNPDLDLVKICHYNVGNATSESFDLAHRADRETIKRIKALAIESLGRWQLQSALTCLWEDLMQFERLEKLIFVMGGTHCSNREAIRERVEKSLRQYRDLLRQRVGWDWRPPVVSVVPSTLALEWPDTVL